MTWIVHHGDCLEILPTLGKVDAVVTDPPYGIAMAARGKIGSENAAPVRDYGSDEWDNLTVSDEAMRVVIASAPIAVIFGGNYYALPPSPCWLVWDKDNTGDFADCELAWTNLPFAVRRLKWRWNGMLQENGGRWKEQRFHPTQKPVPVMRWVIQRTRVPKGSTILDPFCGSGSTGVAALAEGMNFIGIEREAKYVEIARRRIAAEAAQGKLEFT